jgi:hypothetical protein
MTISATTQGLRPGVCTSSNRPVTPFEGQMIYETDTDLTYIYGGSAWQQVSGGTAVGNSGLVYITSATVGTGVSSVTVSGAFSATYDNYRIIYAGGTMSAAQRFGMTLGSSVTGYYEGLTYVNYTGTTGAAGGSNIAAWQYIGGGNTISAGFVVDLQNPFLAQYTQMNAVGALQTTQATWDQGIHAVATSFTAFTVTPVSSTITGGTITVYGYRKA